MGNLQAIEDTMFKLLRNATPSPGATPSSSTPTHLPSRNVLFLEELLKDPFSRDLFLYLSGVFHRPARPHVPSDTFWEAIPGMAQLNCLYGNVNMSSASVNYSISTAHAWAECKAYNLTECTVNGNWGPFRDHEGGEVDWNRVEAAMMVLANNAGGGKWDKSGCMTSGLPFSGSYPYSFSCPILRRDPCIDVDTDPYGITGTWTRVSSRAHGGTFSAILSSTTETRRANMANHSPR